jgi:hypothetical protein
MLSVIMLSVIMLGTTFYSNAGRCYAECPVAVNWTNYDRKKFYRTSPPTGANPIKKFMVVIYEFS